MKSMDNNKAVHVKQNQDIRKEASASNLENQKPAPSSENSGQRIPLDVLFGKQLHVEETGVKEDVKPKSESHPSQYMHQQSLKLMSDPHQYLSQMSPEEIQYLQWPLAQQNYILNQFQQQQQQQQNLHNPPSVSVPSSSTPFMTYGDAQHNVYPNYLHQQYPGSNYAAFQSQPPSNPQVTSQLNQQQQGQQRQQQTYNRPHYPYDQRHMNR